jgi:hypothetical protein
VRKKFAGLERKGRGHKHRQISKGAGNSEENNLRANKLICNF